MKRSARTSDRPRRTGLPLRWLRLPARLLFFGVLALDLVVALLVVGGGGLGLAAPQETAGAAGEPSAASVEQAGEAPNREALELLGGELARRAEELERREQELEELLRGAETLRRAGIEPEPPAEAASAGANESPAAAAGAQPVGEAFARMQRAYANMEPESAALALTKLADRDRDVVVELLAGWSPRVSGAILDALTQTSPQLAADLTYEVWKRSGN